MDIPSKRIITRLILYEQVWKRPTTLMAREFGLSDVGFAKLCKRNGIPRPPRGYWAMLQVGKAPPKTSLPMPERDWDVEISVQAPIGDAPLAVAGEGVNLAKNPSDEAVSVAETLHSAHPLVKASMPLLRVSRCSQYGLLIPAVGCVCVSVSKSRLRRALLIMDALIRCFERRGYTVTCPAREDKLCETRVTIMGVEVPFRIDEYLLEKSGGLTGASPEKASFRLHRPWRYGKVTPSGRLLLSVDEARCKWGVRWSGLRLKWQDGKRQRLEDMIGDIVAGLDQLASYMKTEKENDEKRERERRAEEERKAEVERRRQAMIARISEERRRVKELREEAANWHESRTLRQYIEAVRQSAGERGGDVSADSETGKWLTWAAQQADRLDPLAESPPSVLDEVEKYKEEHPVILGGYGVGVVTPREDESQRTSDFFRKRWLYQRFRGKG